MRENFSEFLTILALLVFLFLSVDAMAALAKENPTTCAEAITQCELTSGLVCYRELLCAVKP